MLQNHLLKHTGQLPDTEIIGRILSGDVALYEILIRRYNPFLYKTGRAYGYNHQDTEDLMQETYINAYQHLSAFENRSSFRTWIVRIMLNECYHKSRKRSFQKEKSFDVTANDAPAPVPEMNNSNDVNRSVINRELSAVIEGSLNRLPVDYRITFTLRELSGLNVAETAQVTSTTAANVKVRLSRAKTMLRKELEKIYSPEDIYEFNLIYCDKMVEAVMKKITE